MTEDLLHPFDRAIYLSPLDAVRFEGELSPDWCIHSTPHGGYLMALIANAMQRVSRKTSTPIITANFARRCAPGAVEVVVEPISDSNQFERYEARLIQDNEEKIRALGTFSRLEDGGEQSRETTPPRVAPIENCHRMPAMPGYSLFDQINVDLDPECAGWMAGRLTQRSEHRGWFGFRAARDLDNAAVLLAADAFPPPVFASRGMVAWVPTLEMSVAILNVPGGRRLKCVFHTPRIHNGILHEDGELWDESGQLIAVSRQIAQFKRSR